MSSNSVKLCNQGKHFSQNYKNDILCCNFVIDLKPSMKGILIQHVNTFYFNPPAWSKSHDKPISLANGIAEIPGA